MLAKFEFHFVILVNEPLLDGSEMKFLIECIDTGWISSNGWFIKRLEDGVAARVGRKNTVAGSNDSVASGIGPGNEVILPSFMIISSAAAIVRAGVASVLVDSFPVTWNMDVNQVADRPMARTKAIMVVHIYGLPVDMDPILELAEKHGLRMVVDTAEMDGQTYNGLVCGRFGELSTFSFYPKKHVATGEGGMILADGDALGDRCRSRRNLCFQTRRFVHEKFGWNLGLSNMQAAVGVAQLERLDEFIEMNRFIGWCQDELLSDVEGFQRPLAKTYHPEGNYWVHGLVIDDDLPFDADEAMARLASQGVATRPFFWPTHGQPVSGRWDFSKASAVASPKGSRGEGITFQAEYVWPSNS